MIYIKGMQGLGDNIYQRAFVRAFKDPIYLETPWPELYEDLPNVRLTKYLSIFRTQKKNLQRTTFINWHDAVSAQKSSTVRTVSYAGHGILNGMAQAFGCQPAEMNLPSWINEKPQWINDLGKFVLIRPVTLRKEWLNPARNPKPMYIYEASRILKDLGWTIVSVADTEPDVEWIEVPEPFADIKYYKGELNVKDLLRLVDSADKIVAPVGWAVPAAQALNKKAFIVMGGNGGFNSPDMISLNNNHQITWIKPDRFCLCKDNKHNCDKEISEYSYKFSNWLHQ